LKISSNKELLQVDGDTLFAFLEDMQNYKQLMPEQIANWEATKENCRFTIPGMTDIGMRLEQSNRYTNVKLHSDGKVPFSFKLDFLVNRDDDHHDHEIYIDFDADMPAMIAMMAKNPLQNLINHMISELKKHFDS